MSIETMPRKKTKLEMDAKKRLAYTLFVQNGFDQKVIAEITGISAVSISKWKTKDKQNGKDWEADRIEQRQGFDNERRRIKKIINTHLDLIESRTTPFNVPTSTEGDTINKMSDAARKLSTELQFAHKSKTLELLVQFLQQTYGHAKAVEVLELGHEFLLSSL